MNKRTINAAISRAGLDVEIQNNSDGYSYFTSTKTGGQVGDSVMVCYLYQQTVAEWVNDAGHAITQEVAS